MARTEVGQPDRIAAGILIILASVAAMAFADAVVKLVSSNLTLWQVFVARSLFALPCLLGLAYLAKAKLGTDRTGWVLVRSGLLILTWLLYYASLPVLSLAVAAVAVYTNPIFTALLAALTLGERVTTRQWAGVLVGFAGVAVIVKPGTDAFSWFLFFPLLGAFFYSLAMIVTRSTCRDEDAIALALNLHGCFIATGLLATGFLLLLGLDGETKSAYPFLLDDWTPMDLADWSVMAALGVLSAVYFLGVARAYQIAPPHIIGTFDYGYLVSAAIWGGVLFGEMPDPYTLVGMMLITVAGLLVAVPTRGLRSSSALRPMRVKGNVHNGPRPRN